MTANGLLHSNIPTSHQEKPSERMTSLQVFVEEIESALPGKLGRSLVIARRRVVVEAVIGALIHMHGVGNVIEFERLFVGGPCSVDTRVQGCIVKQQRRLDARSHGP